MILRSHALLLFAVLAASLGTATADASRWGLLIPHKTHPLDNIAEPLPINLDQPSFVGSASSVPNIDYLADQATSPWFSVDVGPPLLDAATQVAYLEDFGVSPNATDNTDAFMDAVHACPKNRTCYITFRTRGTPEQPGPTYRFAGGTMGAALTFADTTDLIFDGAYSRLLFARPNWTQIGVGWNDWMCTPRLSFDQASRNAVWRDSLVVLDHLQRAYLGKFTMDWDYDAWPLSSLVEVVASSMTSWTLRFVDWPKNLNGGRVDTSMLLGFRVLTAVDPQTGYFGVEKGDEYYPPPGGFSSVTFLDNTTLKLDFVNVTYKYPNASTTQRYLLRHFAYDAHGFWINRCKNCTLDRIVVNAVPGKLVVATDGSTGLQFTNIDMKMAPPPNPNTPGNRFFKRYLTSASDGIFISGSGPQVAIQNVSMENVGDDCINIHDILAVDNSNPDKEYVLNATGAFTPELDLPWSVNVADPTQLIVRANHFAPFEAGDLVEFVSPVTMYTVSYASLVRVGSDGCGDWVLVFNRTIPSIFYNTTTGRWLPRAPFLWNTRYTTQNVLIDNLSCTRTRARGLLLHTSNTIVSNSKISTTSMSCMFVRSDLTEREGRGLQHVGVYGNVLQGCDKNGWNAGGMDFHIWGLVSPGRVGMRDIGIKGNVFRDLTEPAASFRSTSALLFSHNAVSTPALPALLVQDSRGTEVTNNTFLFSSSDLSQASDRAIWLDPASTVNGTIGINTFAASAPLDPVRFPVPPVSSFSPSVPANATVLPHSTPFSSGLGALPRCGSCNNAVPSTGDTSKCTCKTSTGPPSNGTNGPNGPNLAGAGSNKVVGWTVTVVGVVVSSLLHW